MQDFLLTLLHLTHLQTRAAYAAYCVHYFFVCIGYVNHTYKISILYVCHALASIPFLNVTSLGLSFCFKHDNQLQRHLALSYKSGANTGYKFGQRKVVLTV